MTINPEKQYAFRDRDHLAGENTNYGLEYCAAGIVISIDVGKDQSSSPDRALCVMFVTPWGEPTQAWRAVDEVILTELSVDDYGYLEQEIESVFDDETK